MISYDKTMPRKILKTSIAIMIGISILVTVVQPAIAWGSFTHMSIDSKLKGVPQVTKSFPTFTKGGGIAPDIFFSTQNSEIYSTLAHATRSADLGREMLKLATASHSNKEKAFAYGWLSHDASDMIGHKYFVNPKAGTDMMLHYQVEIGVDANLLNGMSISFSIPYGLVQNAYTNTYGTAPSYSDIYNSVQKTAIALFLEKDLIKSGFFDSYKKQYGDFRPIYLDSINYSAEIMNNPSILPNANLGTGEISAIMSDANMAMVNEINNDIRVASEKSLDSGAVNVNIEDNKIDHYFYIGQPTIKNNVAFENIKNKMKENIRQKIETKN